MFLAAMLLVTGACVGADATRPGLTDTGTSSPTTPSGVVLSPSDADIDIGATLTLNPTVTDEDGHPINAKFTPTWASSDTTVAKVSSQGIVTALRNGTAIIKAFAGSHWGRSIIKVHQPNNDSPSTEDPGDDTTPPKDTAGTTSPPVTPPPTQPPPTDPTPTEPPPATVPPATGAGVSSYALISDDFSKYADSKAFLANVTSAHGGTGTPGSVLYNDCHNPSLATIDKSVLYNGHATLKYNMAANTAEVPQLWPSLPHTLTRMWLRVKLRYSPGFTTTGVSSGGTGYKLLGWGWADGYDGRGSLEFENVNQYYFRWTLVPRNTALTSSGTKNIQGGAVSNEWSDGGWYDYIILVEQTKDGTGMRQRFWMTKDGSTPTLRADQSGTMAAGQKAPPIDRIMLGMNFNMVRAATQSQAMWIGQWEVVDGSKYANPFGLAGLTQ
jgi:hypothetical protein